MAASHNPLCSTCESTKYFSLPSLPFPLSSLSPSRIVSGRRISRVNTSPLTVRYKATGTRAKSRCATPNNYCLLFSPCTYYVVYLSQRLKPKIMLK